MSVAGGQSQHWLEVGHAQWLVDKVNIGQRLVMSVAGGQSQHLLEVGHVQGLVDKVNIC